MSDQLRQQLQATLGDAYELERELGGGGMSRVFLAEERALGRRVVIKVLPEESAGALSVERFKREIALAARLQQANIVPLLTAGDLNGLPYFTMPYVDGESLRARLARSGELPVAEAVGVLKEVARALAYAHEHGVVHRDIKPDNVLLSGGTAMVTDFGVAKALSAAAGAAHGGMTATGLSLGTPAYMAPEQAAADPAMDQRADIYAFGCLAYELMTGQPPFAGRPAQAMMAAHAVEVPEAIERRRPTVPAALAALVTRCLEKRPADRPQRASELVQALDGVASESRAAAISPLSNGGPRSFGQALATYALSFVAVALLARVAIVGIGLPDWVFPGSLIVMALALPVIVFTAYAQRVARHALTATPTYTPGGSPERRGAIANIAIKASPHLSWNRAVRFVVVAMGAFVLAIGAFMLMRALGIGPAGSLLATGRMQRREPLLVADFRATRVDTSVGSVVTEAVRADLGQSTAITLVSPASLADALKRMQRPANSRIDLSLAREIAEREGIKAIVDGEVTALGGGFVVAMRLVSADSGGELWSSHATADGTRDLIRAVDDIARKLRGKIGESLRGVQSAPPLERVTTASYEALRKYTEGSRLSDVETEPLAAIPLLREAVALDSNFAMAWRKLAVALENAGNAQSESDAAARHAFELRDHLPEIERLRVEALYFASGPGRDRARAIAAYEASLTRGDSWPALVNLAALLVTRRENERAETLLVAALRRSPIPSVFNLLGYVQLKLGKVDKAAATVVLLKKRFPSNVLSLTDDIPVVFAQGDMDRFQRLLDSARTAHSPDVRANGYSIGSAWAMMRGQVAESIRLYLAGEALAASQGYQTPALVDSLAVMSTVAWFDPDRSAVATRLDAALARTPLHALPVVDRPYLQAATVFAISGRPDRARAMLATYSAEMGDTALRRSNQPILNRALAEIALADRRPKDALDEFRRSDQLPDGPADECSICFYGELARAFDAMNQADSTISMYEKYFSTPYANRFDGDAPLYAALAHERLGQLYDAKGETAKAADHYRAFIDLWKHADRKLQPRVEEARRRLAKLTPVEGSRR